MKPATETIAAIATPPGRGGVGIVRISGPAALRIGQEILRREKALPLRQADLLFVLLSWVFVVARYVHAGIFVTSNNVKTRSLAFFASVLVLLAMWIIFAWKILRVV